MRLTQALPLILAILASTPAPAQFANTVNDNATTPAAPLGTINVIPQNDAGRPTVNVTHYALYPTIQVNCPPSGDLSGPVLAASAALSASGGGILDARRCTGASSWTNQFTFAEANTALLLPCVTLTMTQPVVVNPGIRNTTIHGCAYQGGSATSGTVGGSVWDWQGTGPAFIVGDTADLTNTVGFAISDMAVVTASAGSAASAFAFHRVQEIDMERLYVIGNNGTGQTGILLDGKGNYSGGSFISLQVSGFGSQLTMTGDATGGANASTFVRAHFDCATSSGSPIPGTIGVSLAYGDGNTFTGGDIESCDTMLFLGAGASNNTFTGVRNENSNNQIVALAGSQYNLWLTGGTMFTGKLTDSGTHNSFVDTFHRTWNNLNGDLWRSQSDATITNSVYTGIGLGHVRGRIQEWQTDVPGSPGSYQNAWQWGPGDGTSGAQVWQLLDMINSVPRWGAIQYTTAGGNNQTYLNGAGTGAVCFQCSNNSGTGGVIIASGGATPTTVWNSDSSGNTYQLGRHDFYSGSTLAWSWNCASTGACALQSMTPTANAYHFRAFNGSGTEIDSESTAGVSINATSTSGSGPFTVYAGGAAYYDTTLFQVQNNGNGTANYLLPSIAAESGNNCLQVDNSGYVTNTGHACGTGSGSGSVTSVGLSLPTEFSVANSPVTNSGTLTATWISQAGHSFLAGLDSSSTGTPTFRAIAADDVPTLNQSTTGNAATSTQATNATNVNGGTVSASNGTFSGTVVAGTTTPTTIGSSGVLLNGVTALQAQTSLGNYYTGGSGNLTGTGTYNTANGYEALISDTTGINNTADGYQSLINNNTGTKNTANGYVALYANTSGGSNTANGWAALYYNTSGSNNTADGINAGRFIANGATANQTGNNSVYVGSQAYPNADGDTNENVIGNAAIGHGSNTTTIGSSTITATYLAGNTTTTGFLASNGWTGNYAATFTAGAAAGSGPTIGCLSGHTCTNIQGTVSILTGTLPTTGTLVTINFNHTQNNKLDCATTLSHAGTGQLTAYEATPTTTTLPITIDATALVAATTYTLTYVCGSY